MIHFSARGETSLATACASLAAKSIRELAMHGFNKYWRTLQPDLRPTAGYNMDAGRFLEDTAVLRRELKIADEQFSIPMKNDFESLNVSVAAGIILYEVMKQRM